MTCINRISELALATSSVGLGLPTLTAVPYCTKTFRKRLRPLTLQQGPTQRQLFLHLQLKSSTVLCETACSIQAAVQTEDHQLSIESCKLQLQQELDGTRRGIFGIKASKSESIDKLLSKLESLTRQQCPTQHMPQLDGAWKLLYTSLVIKGARKTKLGLREFVSLGDFEQIIDPDSKLATNRVHFAVTGLGNLSGSLTITATFEAVSAKRVQIKYQTAKLVPKPLEQLFAGNYDLLLSIFNPEGWLDITYLDETHRIGRDDKGNVFYLKRA